MFNNTIDPVAFSFLGLSIRWYGIIYAGSLLFFYFYLLWTSKRDKELQLKTEDVEPFMVGFILAVIIGARLFHVFVYNLSYYLQNPSEILAVWHGGLSFHGGLLFASLWIIYFCRKKKIELFRMTDTLVIPASLFLGFGRIANFINGELIGKVTNASIGVQFQNYDGYRWPTQLFESAKNFVIFFILLGVDATKNQIFKKYIPGLLTVLFLVIYGVVRFFIEFFKDSASVIFGLNTAQILSIATVIFGLYLGIVLYTVNKHVKHFKEHIKVEPVDQEKRK